MNLEQIKKNILHNKKGIGIAIALIAIIIVIVQSGLLKDVILFIIILYILYLFFFAEGFGNAG